MIRSAPDDPNSYLEYETAYALRINNALLEMFTRKKKELLLLDMDTQEEDYVLCLLQKTSSALHNIYKDLDI